VIADKLQGSVAWCGGVVNNQITKGSLLSLPVKKKPIGEYLAKSQARRWLSRALCAPGHRNADSRRKCMTIPKAVIPAYLGRTRQNKVNSETAISQWA